MSVDKKNKMDVYILYTFIQYIAILLRPQIKHSIPIVVQFMDFPPIIFMYELRTVSIIHNTLMCKRLGSERFFKETNASFQ